MREDWGRSDGSHILIADALDPALAKYEGRNLAEIARAEGKDPADVLMDIVIADKGNTGKISFTMNEDDIRTAIRHPLVSMCTDSGASATDGIFSKKRNHPRGWGTTAAHPRQVRPQGEADPARGGGPEDDVAARHADEAAGPRPRARRATSRTWWPSIPRPSSIDRRTRTRGPYSAGIPYVAVNGELVVDGGAITAARPGRILRGPGWARR